MHHLSLPLSLYSPFDSKCKDDLSTLTHARSFILCNAIVGLTQIARDAHSLSLGDELGCELMAGQAFYQEIMKSLL